MQVGVGLLQELEPPVRPLFVTSLLIISTNINSAAWQPRQIMDFTAQVCQTWQETHEPGSDGLDGSVEISKIEIRGNQLGVKHKVAVDDQFYLELDVIDRAGPQPRFISTMYRVGGEPLLMLSLSADCSLRGARKINYSDSGQALNIVSLDKDLAVTGKPEWLNPPLEFLPRNSPDSLNQTSAEALLPIRVGMVDSGVNYTIPLINRHLARDGENRLIGYDFWDMDEFPYDAHPRRSGFFVQRHGTRTASLLLGEAPGIELVPYRYPRPDMSRMQALIEHAARNQVPILGMPLGSDRAEEWLAFEQAARAHPQILFIASAGNNGRDIDDDPVYPAALDLDNMLVVTSADDFVRPAERTNWGSKTVDYLIPAENVTLTDYSGAEITASGTSYAVPRLAALAAKIKMAHRQWSVAEIIAELRRRYSSNITSGWVSTGYIADPLAGDSVQFKPLPDVDINNTTDGSGSRLPLDILVLDPAWTHQRIQQILQSAFDLLAQCNISAGDISIQSFVGDDYLRDLSTGNAHTLLSAVNGRAMTVVFARDTRMQEPFTGEAFGLGNTIRRPWLANSVWLMPDIEDEGLALAHELFHVISNNGEHVEGTGNLMQSRTNKNSQTLTEQQCKKARITGLANRLLDIN